MKHRAPASHDNLPAPVRAGLYAATMIIGVLALLVIGIGEIWFPAAAAKIAATAGVITATTDLIAGGIATIYRPHTQGPP
jgi:predicted phage tail protein